MIFYLIPPRTCIELSNFEKCCLLRFTNFLEAEDTKNNEKIDRHLVVDSESDQIGHFILRCFCVYKPAVKDFIAARETDLFFYRLETMSWEKKQKLCEDTVEQIRRAQNFKLYDPITRNKEKPFFAELLWSTLIKLCKTLSSPRIGDHMSEHCDINCKIYLQKVPFQMCLSFARNRSVVIRKGFAFVPCSMWNLLLAELFTHHYEFGLSMISSTIYPSLISDSRWTEAFAKLSSMYDSFTKNQFMSRTRLTAKQIDEEKCRFPPCMAHLLTVLRTHHRLSHNWRYRFSLFLKDIGLDVDESIEFWKNEYSKSCTAESRCTHSWQTNHRKYLYSIRHLYGLVGNCQKKETKSCLAYEDMKLGMREEGGCPFVHFDDTNLMALLSEEIEDNANIMNEIFKQKMLKNPTKACSVYQAACARKYRLQMPLVKFKSPVEYYKRMKLCFDTTLEW